MTLEAIQKLVRKHVPKDSIWRSNIRGDNDYFNVEIIKRKPGVPRGYVHLTTSIGSSRYGTWSKFDIKIFNGASKDEVINRIQHYVEYYQKCGGVSASYAKVFAEHVRSTDGHSGNPVWMD